MLSRFISKPSNLRFLTSIVRTQKNPNPIFPNSPISAPSLCFFLNTLNFYSTNGNNGKNDGRDSAPHIWDLSSETDSSIDSIFGEDSEITKGILNEEVQLKDQSKYGSWMEQSSRSGDGIDEVKGGDGGEELATGQEFKPWSLTGDEKEDEDKLFELGAGEFPSQGLGGVEEALETKKTEQEKQLLQEEEKIQTAILEGPNRAFGDLISASGITEDMLDSLMALKDLEGIEGLPPLRDIEDRRYEKTLKTNTRAEIERQKQEEIAKARVRQVDEKGRAYGTGRRKCSIARVWVQPGDGRFLVNDKEFDVYFPMLDNRAALLRPFSETKTLGQWDVKCTVKGGGVSGQVGAIQLGISRALQNWAPDMRPPLREAGFLTRDSRVVERKKPGKAKARKSFQWVKR